MTVLMPQHMQSLRDGSEHCDAITCSCTDVGIHRPELKGIQSARQIGRRTQRWR